MNNISQQFYHACYHGHLEEATQFIESDPTILTSHDLVKTCFFYTCMNGHLPVAQWLVTQVSTDILFTPYLLIDVCNMCKSLPMAQWIYSTFPINLAKQNHFAFMKACESHSNDIVEWLITLKPYKYYLDESGNGHVRSDEDERWERRKYAMMFFYKTTTHTDIWRKIIKYI